MQPNFQETDNQPASLQHDGRGAGRVPRRPPDDGPAAPTRRRACACSLHDHGWRLHQHDLDHGRRRASLGFEAAQHAAMQRLIRLAGQATAVGYLDSVKLQFDVQHLVLVHGTRDSVLQRPCPPCYTVSSAASFRVRTPANAAPTATLRHPRARHAAGAARARRQHRRLFARAARQRATAGRRRPHRRRAHRTRRRHALRGHPALQHVTGIGADTAASAWAAPSASSTARRSARCSATSTRRKSAQRLFSLT